MRCRCYENESTDLHAMPADLGAHGVGRGVGKWARKPPPPPVWHVVHLWFLYRAFGAPIAGFFGHSTRIISSLCCTHHVLASQKYVLQHPSPTVSPRKTRRRHKHNPLYFHFQDRWIEKKRQEAYDVAQKACSTPFLNTPMPTLCEFIRQAARMARIRCVRPK